MKAARLLLVTVLTQGCATSEEEAIELHPSDKADGSLGTALLLQPNRSIPIWWQCNERLENGCDTTVTITVKAAPQYSVSPGILVGAFEHNDSSDRWSTVHLVRFGSNTFSIEAAGVSTHRGELFNDTSIPLVFGVVATWE